MKIRLVSFLPDVGAPNTGNWSGTQSDRRRRRRLPRESGQRDAMPVYHCSAAFRGFHPSFDLTFLFKNSTYRILYYKIFLKHLIQKSDSVTF